MNITASRIVKYVLLAFALLTALLALYINAGLASFAENVFPGSFLWTHGALLAIESLAFLWFWRGIFGGSKHLLLVDDESPKGRERFARELVRRLRKNPRIREAGLTPSGPADKEKIEACMAFLNEKADQEIHQTARRVFLATALSQNGRLDAFIVFVSLCRLVWRIAALYNQRPHPREIASLYIAVVTSVFLALSLEELDVSTEISIGFGHAFNAMAPAGAAASIPFAGKALQTFTTAAIDGAANCYLTLRTGIVARNAYAYAFADQRPKRAAVYREAGATLLTMSASLMDKLSSGVADGLAGAVRYAQDKTVKAGKGIVESIGRVGSGLSVAPGRNDEACEGVDSAGTAADAAGNIVDAAAEVTRAAISSTLTAAAKPFAHILKKESKK